MNETDRTRLQELLTIHRTTLHHLLSQAGMFGPAHIPSHVVHSIADVRKDIRTIKASLRTAGVVVDDIASDEASPDGSPAVADAQAAFLRTKTTGFVGRGFVFDAWERFLRTERSGYFDLIGEPGAGKSTIMAALAERNGYIAHFNTRAESPTTSVQAFLTTVCPQIIARYGLNLTIPLNASQDGSFLRLLLYQIAPLLTSESPLVLVVDALDEVEATIQGNVLFLPDTLPDHVYIAISRRPRDHLRFTTHSPYHPFVIEDYPAENARDIEEKIVTTFTDRPVLQAWLTKHQLEQDAVVTMLVDKSDANFMYIHYVLADLEKEDGIYHDRDLALLPKGLDAYYRSHWELMGMARSNHDEEHRQKLRIIYVLGYIKRPASRQLLAEFAGADPLAVQYVLSAWSEFFHAQTIDTTKRYSVYHASFRDFLFRQDTVDAIKEDIDIPALQRSIADQGLRTIEQTYGVTIALDEPPSVFRRFLSLFRPRKAQE